MSHKHLYEGKIGFAIIVTSDTRNFENDESGSIMKRLIEEYGYIVAYYDIVKNDKEKIKEKLEETLKNENVNVIIFSGGTGISKRDVTVDAVKPLLEKELPGFGEIFRWLSYKEIGSAAIMSRAFAGIKNGKAIFCLPGSKNAVELAMKEIILREAAHIMGEVNK